MSNSKRSFMPTEVIFATTSACNLSCQHCFTSKSSQKLNTKDAVRFLETCRNTTIEKVGFSGGGEPFLYTEFLEDVIKSAVKNDFMFDRIMTNGDWWNKAPILNATLQKIYDAGYDGKIGLSWDAFHGQDFNRICVFIQEVLEVFGGESLVIQSVISTEQTQIMGIPSERDLMLFNFHQLAEHFGLTFDAEFDKKTGRGFARLQGSAKLARGEEYIFIPIYIEKQTFDSTDERAWQSGTWFKDDYCEGPGQILFVHPTGDIAPCCGFANEEKNLFIGTIKDTYEQVLKKANSNAMVELCYKKGLSTKIKQMEEQEITFPLNGKTDDLCTFCQFVCRQESL